MEMKLETGLSINSNEKEEEWALLYKGKKMQSKDHCSLSFSTDLLCSRVSGVVSGFHESVLLFKSASQVHNEGIW